MDWIIRCDPTQPDAPVGAVVAYGGDDPGQASWLPCDGRALDSATYSALSAVIGTTYGTGSGAGNFRLPDYRGFFLRGRDRGSGKDPDAGGRFAPGTALPVRGSPSTAGDKMGSVQNFATGRPANPFTTNVPCLPTHAEQVFSTVWDHRVGDVRSDSVTIQTNTHGGDAETRPSNVYLTYLIRVR